MDKYKNIKNSKILNWLLERRGLSWEDLQIGARTNQEKQMIAGAGIFRNEFGMKDLSTNTLMHYWREPISGAIALLFFAAFWNSIVGFLMLQMLKNGPMKVNSVPYESVTEAFAANPFMYIFAIFPIVGIILIYSSIAIFVNKSVFKFEYNKVSVKHGPLPLNKNIDLIRGEVQQIYVQRRVHKSNRNRSVNYRVMAQLINKSDGIVYNGLANYSDARILEQWLEQKLGIEDIAVPGEAV